MALAARRKGINVTGGPRAVLAGGDGRLAVAISLRAVELAPSRIGCSTVDARAWRVAAAIDPRGVIRIGAALRPSRTAWGRCSVGTV
jgi:hypothetical protein